MFCFKDHLRGWVLLLRKSIKLKKMAFLELRALKIIYRMLLKYISNTTRQHVVFISATLRDAGVVQSGQNPEIEKYIYILYFILPAVSPFKWSTRSPHSKKVPISTPWGTFCVEFACFACKCGCYGFPHQLQRLS